MSDPLVIMQESALKRVVDEAVAQMMVEIRAVIAEAMQSKEAAQKQADDKLLTVDELCGFLGVSRSDWYRKKKRYPQLKALQRGRLWLGEGVRQALSALR